MKGKAKAKFIQIAVASQGHMLSVFALDGDGKVYLYHWDNEDPEYCQTWLQLDEHRGEREL